MYSQGRSIDFAEIDIRIQKFIAREVASANAEGVVIGLSGGLDSSVTAVLCAKALGSNKVLGLLMPDERVTPKEDIDDANQVARLFDIKTESIDIAHIHKGFMRWLQADRLAEGNLRARIRMCLLYYYSNLTNRIVIGTGDKSEFLIGYFTKYGDGGVDIQPLIGLYKTEVRQLARHLGLPPRIIEKKSAPRLWESHEAEQEIGVDYDLLDSILYCIFDMRLSPEETSKHLNVSQGIVSRVLSMHRQSEHKRLQPPCMLSLLLASQSKKIE